MQSLGFGGQDTQRVNKSSQKEARFVFKITVNKGTCVHKCVNCGVTIQYYHHGSTVCKICKTRQDFYNIDRTTDIPCNFMLGDDIWRVWYHLTYTN
jgi:hypothetical protein